MSEVLPVTPECKRRHVKLAGCIMLTPEALALSPPSVRLYHSPWSKRVPSVWGSEMLIYFEPTLDALSLRSDVTSSIKIMSLIKAPPYQAREAGRVHHADARSARALHQEGGPQPPGARPRGLPGFNFSNRNGSRTCLVQKSGLAGTNLGCTVGRDHLIAGRDPLIGLPGSNPTF